jgi:hypothetical protein
MVRIYLDGDACVFLILSTELDRKPSEFPPVDLPPELQHGSVSLGPTTVEYVKSEQGDAVRVKPEAPESDLQGMHALRHVRNCR